VNPAVKRAGARDLGLLVARLGFGGLMFTHGLDKITGWDMLTDGVTDVANHNYEFMSVLGMPANISLVLAIAAEAGAAAMVGLGLMTRFAALAVVFTMGVAAYLHLVEFGDPLSKAEPALIYGIGFLTLALTGPGRLSLDTKLAGRRVMGK
jgi:putative oxidoreductase